MNEKIFAPELSLLKNETLRKLVCAFLASVPAYFKEIPASSTGRYHPSFDSGTAGLTRHAKTCVSVALALMRHTTYETCDPDIVISGCLLHDCFKNGYIDSGHTIQTHDYVCATEFRLFSENWIKNARLSKGCEDRLKLAVEMIERCIHTHMGQWCTDLRVRECYNYNEARLVAFADFIASRQFFDKWKLDESGNWIDTEDIVETYKAAIGYKGRIGGK